MSEERIKISLNEEDVQNILNAYEKDIEYIKHLESVLKEIREYIKEHENESIYLDCKLYETKVYNDLLEVIDKVIDKGIGEDK